MGAMTADTVFLLGWAVLGVIGGLGAVVDAVRAPADAWRRTGQSRTLWLVTLLVSCVAGAGLLAVAAYLIIPFRPLHPEGQQGRGVVPQI